jgi:5-methylcytosine-specific restriction endonuclease McrA
LLPSTVANLARFGGLFLEEMNMPKSPYNAQWQRARLVFLQQHPFCKMCELLGIITVATVVDHRTPHKGNMQLFWSQNNWIPLCASCHSRHKQRIEGRGKFRPCNPDGSLIDLSEVSPIK